MTRLGKHINTVRRKSDQKLGKKLARRMKQLVKRWIQLLPPAPSNGIGGGAGSSISTAAIEPDSATPEPSTSVAIPLSSAPRPPPLDRAKSRDQLMHMFSKLKKPQTTPPTVSTQAPASLPTRTDVPASPLSPAVTTAQTDLTINAQQQVLPTPPTVCESYTALSSTLPTTASQAFQTHKPSPFVSPASHANSDSNNFPINLPDSEIPSVTACQSLPITSPNETVSLHVSNSLQVSLPIEYYAKDSPQHSNRVVLQQAQPQATEQLDAKALDHHQHHLPSSEPAAGATTSDPPSGMLESGSLLSSALQTKPSLSPLPALPPPLRDAKTHEPCPPLSLANPAALRDEPGILHAAGAVVPTPSPAAQEKVESLIVQVSRKSIKLSSSESTGPCLAKPLSLIVSIDTGVLQRIPGVENALARKVLTARRRKKRKLKRSSTPDRNIEPSVIVSNPTKEESLFWLPHEPRQKPPDFVAGIDGCFGGDGFWYDWTEPIFSQQHLKAEEVTNSDGIPVTVLPYVYVDTDLERAIANQCVS